ncbi:CHASE2 domain-containing protein [Neisseria sp. Ec49-e6-T10]|uniref:CHASE2 domain-containing protein n=1 Tax=Neisseria sp. Ec49-e6-T10 TaxID=3140744 RepID=UPI003EC093F5
MFLPRGYGSKVMKLLPWIIGVFVWVLLLKMVPEGGNKLESAYYDFIISHASQEKPNNDIVIIGIDQDSLNRIGPWSWPRRYHAYLLEHLKNTKAIGIDILFSDPDIMYPDSDEYFARAISKNGKVALPVIANEESSTGELLPLFVRSARSVGYVNFFPDNDNVVRRLQNSDQKNTNPAHLYQKSFPEAILQAGGISVEKKSYRLRDWLAKVSHQASWLIPYSNRETQFPLFSYDQVLRAEISEDYFQDKIVLVGSTAASLQDRQMTPSKAFAGDLSGVLILANITNAFLNDDLILAPSKIVQFIFAALSFSLLFFIASFIKKDRLSVYFVFCLVLLVVTFILFIWCRIWFPITSLILCILGIGLGKALVQTTSFQFMAFTDALTGLSNRYSFEMALNQIAQKSYRKKEPISFILIDLDFFKKYNDTYGHDLGDEVLRKIGQLLNKQRRRGEIAARLGGEEFAVVIPNSNETEARYRAEAIRKGVLNLAIEHEGSHIKFVSISVGVCVGVATIDAVNERLHYQEADIALYDVKQKGRNCVEVRTL